VSLINPKKVLYNLDPAYYLAVLAEYSDRNPI